MAQQQKKELTGWQKPALGFIVSLLLAYLLGSWSIDGGSLIVYGLTFAAAYAALRFLIQLIKNVFSHEQTSKTRRAQKAH